MRILHATLWHKEKSTLCDVNITIKKGEWIFLVGPSGTGKSTILQTICGMLPPLTGSVIDDRWRDVYGLRASELRAYRRTLGMVFQDTQMIDYKTVKENIAYAMEICKYSHTSIERRTEELLQQVGMWEKRDILPSHLSWGEAQKIAIARALIHEPNILLADEPTGHLDRDNVDTIMSLFATIHRAGTTVIFSTHDDEILTMIPGARIIDVAKWKV